jgi:aspartate/glutamate racemase
MKVIGLIGGMSWKSTLEYYRLILGCTELLILTGPADAPVSMFNSTRLHAEAAVKSALSE